jgi:hypothetical protein
MSREEKPTNREILVEVRWEGSEDMAVSDCLRLIERQARKKGIIVDPRTFQDRRYQDRERGPVFAMKVQGWRR